MTRDDTLVALVVGLLMKIRALPQIVDGFRITTLNCLETRDMLLGKPMDLCAVPRTIRTEILPSITCPSGVVAGGTNGPFGQIIATSH